MSLLLLIGIVIVLGSVIFKTWRKIEQENIQTPIDVSTETIVETTLTEVVPPVHVDSQITDAVTVKKPRKPRTPKVKDAGTE